MYFGRIDILSVIPA